MFPFIADRKSSGSKRVISFYGSLSFHSKLGSKLTAVAYLLGPFVVLVWIVLQLVQLAHDMSRIFAVYFRGIRWFERIVRGSRTVAFREEISQRVVQSPALGFQSQPEAVILWKNGKLDESECV